MPAEKKIIKRLEKCGAPYEIRDVERDFEGSSQDASALMHVDIRQIAKTLVYKVPFGAAAIIASGDAMISQDKFQKQFGVKPQMLKEEELVRMTGCHPGAVYPVAISSRRVKTYMDISLKRCGDLFVYISGGNDTCAVGVPPQKLFEAAECMEWVDICKDWINELPPGSRGL